MVTLFWLGMFALCVLAFFVGAQNVLLHVALDEARNEKSSSNKSKSTGWEADIKGERGKLACTLHLDCEKESDAVRMILNQGFRPEQIKELRPV